MAACQTGSVSSLSHCHAYGDPKTHHNDSETETLSLSLFFSSLSQSHKAFFCIRKFTQVSGKMDVIMVCNTTGQTIFIFRTMYNELIHWTSDIPVCKRFWPLTSGEILWTNLIPRTTLPSFHTSVFSLPSLILYDFFLFHLPFYPL